LVKEYTLGTRLLSGRAKKAWKKKLVARNWYQERKIGTKKLVLVARLQHKGNENSSMQEG